MAHMIGVTYQQAHKYERGINRISADRLYEIARVLRLPVSYFFEGLEGDGGADELSTRQRMCLELARNFTQIPNERHREALKLAGSGTRGEVAPAGESRRASF